MSLDRGQPRKLSDAQIEQVIVRTLESRPKAATHWSTRTMAEATGLHQTAISRIWRAFRCNRIARRASSSAATRS